MKILKILIVLLLPVLGMVSCAKSTLKPANEARSTSTNTDSFSASRDGEIYGPDGDDDRDGGDKKKKKSTTK